MRVNIMVGNADLSWIGGRFARELVQRMPSYGVHAEINEPSGWGDLEYQQIVYGAPTSRPAVGMFTHGDFRPHKFAREYDGCVCLNKLMASYALEGGAADLAVIEMPVADIFRPTDQITFGVAGRTYSDGRKGEALIAKMVEAGYYVIAWGSGWPCPIVSRDLEDLPGFYASLDYYVDTSTDEGGCVPVLEAMAMGVPVISHTVGVDRPVLAYERGDWESLNRVLHRLTHPRTYDDWAADHAAYFKAVLARVAVPA